MGVQGDGAALAALVVGEEDEALVVDFLEQHDAGVGVAVFVHGGHVHGGGLVNLRVHGGIEPLAELFEGLVGAVGLGQRLFAVVLADVVQVQFVHGVCPWCDWRYCARIGERARMGPLPEGYLASRWKEVACMQT